MIVKSVLVLTSLLSTCAPGIEQQRRCPSIEPLLRLHDPGWDVERMSRIAWRESRCTPAIRSTTSDTGVLQINDINHDYLIQALDEPVTEQTLMDPAQNIRAAAALFEFWERANGNGYQPWKATDD